MVVGKRLTLNELLVALIVEGGDALLMALHCEVPEECSRHVGLLHRHDCARHCSTRVGSADSWGYKCLRAVKKDAVR